MRLDHLLSKENSKDWLYYYVVKELATIISGAYALRGHTRSHPEHDG